MFIIVENTQQGERATIAYLLCVRLYIFDCITHLIFNV